MRNVDGEARSLAEPALDVDVAVQAAGDEIVDDVQAEPGVAAAPAGGEERIEHLADRFSGGDAAAVVGEYDAHRGLAAARRRGSRVRPACPSS